MLPAVTECVRRAFSTSQALELRKDQMPAQKDVILVRSTTVPNILRANLQLINSTRLGSILCIEPRFALEPRIIQAFRMSIQTCRTALVLGVDLYRATVSVAARAVCELERPGSSEDPLFDEAGSRMLALFDARRVAPVLIVTSSGLGPFPIHIGSVSYTI